MIIVSSGWACHSRGHFLTCGTLGTATFYLHSSQRSRPAVLCSHSPLPPLVSVSIHEINTTIKLIRQTLHCISWKGNKSNKVLLLKGMWILTSVLSLISLILLFPMMFFSFRRKWQEMLVFHQRNQKYFRHQIIFNEKYENTYLFSELSQKVSADEGGLPMNRAGRLHLSHIQQQLEHKNPCTSYILMNAPCSFTESQHENTPQGVYVPTCSLPASAWSRLSTQRSSVVAGPDWLDQTQKCHVTLH